MDKNLLNHSFYIKLPHYKSFTVKEFIFKIDDKGYHTYNHNAPIGYRISTLKPDYEKWCTILPPCDGAVKIVKHKDETIIKLLDKVLKYKENYKEND